ncbi:MAG: DUF4434 domain-containing protein [bacterium]
MSAKKRVRGRNRCQPRIYGSLWWLTDGDRTRPKDDWLRELDAMQAVGMNTLLFNGTQHHLEWLTIHPEEDRLDWLLGEMDRRGMQAILETYTGHLWYADWDKQREIGGNQEVISELWSRYRKHGSFRTFYIGYEIYLVWREQSCWIRDLYAAIVDLCRKDAPGTKVIISPFFILDDQKRLGNFQYAEPEEYAAWWTETLRLSGIDIIALQDSGEHLSFYTVEQRRPFLAAVQWACAKTGKEFWVNVETGHLQCEGWEDYLRDYNCSVNDPKTQEAWCAVPQDMLEAKLRLAAQYGTRIITWGYQQYFSPSEAWTGNTNLNNLAAYEIYHDYVRSLSIHSNP